MTGEKALEILEHNWYWTCLLNYSYTEEELCEAHDIIIKSMELLNRIKFQVLQQDEYEKIHPDDDICHVCAARDAVYTRVLKILKGENHETNK